MLSRLRYRHNDYSLLKGVRPPYTVYILAKLQYVLSNSAFKIQYGQHSKVPFHLMIALVGLKWICGFQRKADGGGYDNYPPVAAGRLYYNPQQIMLPFSLLDYLR